jgi:hypothetical protein
MVFLKLKIMFNKNLLFPMTTVNAIYPIQSAAGIKANIGI